jgi:hypothetical protein
MYYETIDGELCVIDNQDELFWTFRRENFSRACYKFMTNWLMSKTNPDVDDPAGIWSDAEQAWDALSDAEKGQLVQEVVTEQQNAHDLSQGLLANLHVYQGLKHIKQAFETAIKSVARTFMDS